MMPNNICMFKIALLVFFFFCRISGHVVNMSSVNHVLRIRFKF